MKAIALNTYNYVSNYVITHELGHSLGLVHPFDFAKNYPDYIYIPDLKGKPSIMNYDNGDINYPYSDKITNFDKQVLKYIYEFSTSEEVTFDNVSEFLKQKCGL